MQKISFSKKNILITLIIVIALIFLYTHWSSFGLGHKMKQVNVPITVAKVIQKNVNVPLTVIGNVQAYSTVNVQSLVDGQLLKTGFTQGDFVKKGQLLFQIDPRPFDAALKQAQATLAHDQAQLDNAQNMVKRNKMLSDKGYIAKQDYDQLVSNKLALEASIKADQAAITSAQLQLNYSTINSPIDGRTGSLQVYPGNIVKAAGNTTLVTITQINPIFVVFSVPQQYLDSLQEAMRKEKVVVYAKVGDQTETGYLSFIDNTIDTTTGTVQLKATFPNENKMLWPGHYVTVTLPITHLNDALLIPNVAVQTGQSGTYVFVIEKQFARYQEVKLGPQLGNQVIVMKGLVPNELVATDGQLQLTDGSSVNITATAP